MPDLKGDQLKEVLRGYSRGDILRLDTLASIENWPVVAADELQRRATRVVQVLDDATLTSIASGDLDVVAVCQELCAEL
jgi:hypothetical protein